MNKKYTHLFFDLDNTLWDYDANSYEALKIALRKLGLLQKIKDYPIFYSNFYSINEECRILFRENKISKREKRVGRFEKTLVLFGISINGIADAINEAYLKEISLQLKLIDGAKEILDYLHGKYRLAIITNGFMESQREKIEQSGLIKYFEKIFLSEEIGSQKPDPLIFKHAIRTMNASEDSSLMIGDSWTTDVLGAMRMGIDQIYFNPKLRSAYPDSTIVEFRQEISLDFPEATHNDPVEFDKKSSTRIIFHLKQLLEIL